MSHSPTSCPAVWADMLEAWLPPALQPAESDLWVVNKAADLDRRLQQVRVHAHPNPLSWAAHLKP